MYLELLICSGCGHTWTAGLSVLRWSCPVCRKSSTMSEFWSLYGRVKSIFYDKGDQGILLIGKESCILN